VKILVAILMFVLLVSTAHAKTLTIAVDISSSNALVSSKEFARSAGKYVREQVAKLEMGDVVYIRPIGDRSMANFKVETIKIDRRMRPDKAAAAVGRYIEDLPNKPHEGSGATELIAFLEFTQLDCANNGQALILTDGVESSEYLSGDKFLAGKPLPKPQENLLSGCTITMLGFGQSVDGQWPPQAIKAMRASWQTWMKAAGATFNPIINL